MIFGPPMLQVTKEGQMIKIISPVTLTEQITEQSGQLLMLQESFLLQLVREQWSSLETVKERLCQLKLVPIVRQGVKLRYAAVQIELPPDWNKHGKQTRLNAEFQTTCREAAGGWKHVYPFCDAVNPRLMYFLILAKEERDESKPFILELQKHIESLLNLKSTAAIGMEVKGLKRLRRAFASSMLAFNRSPISMNNGFIDNTEISKLSAIPAELERNLVQSLEAPDRCRFERELDVLLALGEKEAGPHDPALYHAFLLLLNLTAIAGKYECSGSALLKYLWNSPMTLASCTSRTALKQRLLELAELVMGDVRLTRHSGGRYLAEAVRKYLDRNYGCGLSTASVALMYGVDEASLSRQFKQHVGVSPDSYINRIRMAKAEQLLQDYALKLTDLAALVGCSSMSHFVSAYKKYSGLSPKEYRERVLRNR